MAQQPQLPASEAYRLRTLAHIHPGKVTRVEVSRLESPVQVHCGTADRNVSIVDIQELERMLRAQATPLEVHFYEGADHGFLAYTRPFYKPDAAKLAWARTIEFLHKHLE